MTTQTRRPLRLLAASALSATVVASALMVPAPANAAWTWGGTMDGGKQQLCKKRVDGKWKVRMRIDNRNGRSKLYAGVSVIRNDRTVANARTQARRGTLSSVVSVKARRGDTISHSLGTGSAGGGGDRALSQITRC